MEYKMSQIGRQYSTIIICHFIMLLEWSIFHRRTEICKGKSKTIPVCGEKVMSLCLLVYLEYDNKKLKTNYSFITTLDNEARTKSVCMMLVMNDHKTMYVQHPNSEHSL